MNYLKYGKTEDNSSYHIIDTDINDDNITHDIIDHLEMDCSANDQSVRYYFSDQNYIIIKSYRMVVNSKHMVSRIHPIHED